MFYYNSSVFIVLVIKSVMVFLNNIFETLCHIRTIKARLKLKLKYMILKFMIGSDVTALSRDGWKTGGFPIGCTGRVCYQRGFLV